MAAKHQNDEELLAALGYKQEFQREFTSFEVFGVAFSIIGLLPSIASVLALSIPYGGASSMIWGWAVGSIFILFIGMALGELASAAPTSGGLYFWTHSLSSPRSRNLLAWIVGYANSVSTIAAVASIDWGCAVQIGAAAAIGSNGSYTATNAQIYGIYVAVVVSHAVICSLATRVLARLQTIYIVLNVILCLGVIIALPAATPKQYMNDAGYAFGNFLNTSGYPDGFAFILGMLAVHWTIGGYDAAVHISEEASNAAVAVPKAIVGAIGISGILGTAIMIALAFCMGTDMDAILGSSIEQPMAAIFFQSFGQKPTLGLWAIVVIVQYMMGSSMLLASSRQVFAFSRDGALPFSGWLYNMNKTTKTPVHAVIFAATCAILLCLLAFAGLVAINAIFSLCVVAAYMAYSIPIIARFAFKNDFQPGPWNLGRWSFPVSVIAVVWMAFISIVFLFPTTRPTSVGTMNYTVVVLGGTIILSLVWYYFPKYGGVHWFQGPIANVSPAETRSTSAEPREKIDEKEKHANAPQVETHSASSA